MPFNRSQYSELTDEQFLLIGRIVVEFSTIELVQSFILSKLLLSPDFLGRAYTENINSAQVQAMIKNACDIHERRYHYKVVSQELLNRVKSACQKAESLRVQRNKFAHYCWSRWTDDQIFGAKYPGKHFNERNPDAGTLEISLQELKGIQQETYAISDELSDILALLPDLEEDKKLVDLLQYKTKN